MTTHDPSVEAEVLWTPDPDRVGGTALADFVRWLNEHRHLGLDPLDYAALHRWSVSDLDGFWSALAEYFGVRFHDRPAGRWRRRGCQAPSGFPAPPSTTPSTS